MRLGNEPRAYAEGFLQTSKPYMESPLACVSGTNGADLKSRIERIMVRRASARLDFGRKLLLAAVGVAAVGVPLIVGLTNAPAVRAQSSVPPDATRPHFEVASVKIVNHPVPFHPYSLNVSHGTLTIDAVPLRDIVALAYQTRIQGGPSWIDSERYDIEAKTENKNATRDCIRSMLRTLLVDRFKLAFHTETRQVPLYTLVVAKNGPKVEEAKEDEQTWIATGPEPGYHLTFRKWPIKGLAATIQGLLGKPVLDKTGLPGFYDFKLDFASPSPQPGQDAEPVDSGASLFTAVQEQLGLKLEAGKGPIEEMVIGHVDHASEN
jgi:uncharacterized protein (TIGR03435 family)